METPGDREEWQRRDIRRGDHWAMSQRQVGIGLGNGPSKGKTQPSLLGNQLSRACYHWSTEFSLPSHRTESVHRCRFALSDGYLYHMYFPSRSWCKVALVPPCVSNEQWRHWLAGRPVGQGILQVCFFPMTDVNICLLYLQIFLSFISKNLKLSLLNQIFLLLQKLLVLFSCIYIMNIF